MAKPLRDLSHPDVWASSLERSLERRRRSRRASVELWTLRDPRNLADGGVLGESLRHAQARRAAERPAGLPTPAGRRLSLLGVLAVSATPAASALASGSPSPTSEVSGQPATEGVGALQGRLGIAADGVFGPETDAALRAFQATHGLAADGVAGPGTRAALGLPRGGALAASQTLARGRAAGAPAPVPAPSGTGVAELQSRLGVPADGDFGPVTAQALRGFQAAHGLTADAVVGPQTRAALALGDGAQLSATQDPQRVPGAASASLARVMPAAIPAGIAGLQRALGVSADGRFGPATGRALRAFQRAHGLRADAVAGALTRAALGVGPGPALRSAQTTAQPSGPAPRAQVAVAPEPANPRETPAPTVARAPRSGVPASAGASAAVGTMIAAGNQIARTPYVYGGGHGSFTSGGYDCSGSVSYVLHAAGLLNAPRDSGSLEGYGAAGPGSRVTIYANAAHAFMTIDGRRFDTVALGQTGSRWSSARADTGGYTARHPAGL